MGVVRSGTSPTATSGRGAERRWGRAPATRMLQGPGRGGGGAGPGGWPAALTALWPPPRTWPRFLAPSSGRRRRPWSRRRRIPRPQSAPRARRLRRGCRAAPRTGIRLGLGLGLGLGTRMAAPGPSARPAAPDRTARPGVGGGAPPTATSGRWKPRPPGVREGRGSVKPRPPYRQWAGPGTRGVGRDQPALPSRRKRRPAVPWPQGPRPGQGAPCSRRPTSPAQRPAGTVDPKVKGLTDLFCVQKDSLALFNDLKSQVPGSS